MRELTKESAMKSIGEMYFLRTIAYESDELETLTEKQTFTKQLVMFLNVKTLTIQFEFQSHASQESQDEWDDEEFEQKHGYNSKTFDVLDEAIAYYNMKMLI